MAAVYRTAGEDDARFIADLLAASGLNAELVLDGEEAVLYVPSAAEEEAVRLIAQHLEDRGLRPEEGAAATAAHASCPNCAGPAPDSPGAACADCGYAVNPSVGEPAARVKDLFADARTVCADCCAPSTKDSGTCADCGGPLEAAERDAPVCPAEAHVLVKGEGPGWVCPGCRAAWLGV